MRNEFREKKSRTEQREKSRVNPCPAMPRQLIEWLNEYNARRVRVSSSSCCYKQSNQKRSKKYCDCDCDCTTLFFGSFTISHSFHSSSFTSSYKNQQAKGTWWTMPSLSVYGWLLFKILIKKSSWRCLCCVASLKLNELFCQ